MNAVPIKRAPTLFLKAVIVGIALAVVVMCAFVFPMLYTELMGGLPRYAFVIYPGLFGFYTSLLPFLFALYQAFTLLHFIDTNKAFSELSVHALHNIKYSAVAMSVLYAMCMPLVYVFAEADDSPGSIVIGMAFTCAPLVVATFAAVLQKLVRSAIDMKTENDLTI